MTQVRDIVVIGAALGGVSAIAKIALGWPAHLPASVLVALATPDQPAPMVLQIIESYAPVRVGYAIEGEAVQPRKIYLSPPGKTLVVKPGGILSLTGSGAFDIGKQAVNRLFTSAAEVYGNRVIGIILSGNSSDGAQGMRDIEAAGGVGIVQDPDDAVAPRMPRNAIQNDHPNYCVKAAAIAPLVQRLMAADRPEARRPVAEN